MVVERANADVERLETVALMKAMSERIDGLAALEAALNGGRRNAFNNNPIIK